MDAWFSRFVLLGGAVAVLGGAGPAWGERPQAVQPPDAGPLLPGWDELEAVLGPDAQGRPLELADVIVRSASRVPTTLQEAPATVSTLGPRDLRMLGARTLAEALRWLPELDVTRDSFGFHHVAIRGRKADTEVLVLLDGIRINDFYDGRILYDIPVSMIESIEVIRGPGSALYGTNAFAGVIYVASRRTRGFEVGVTGGTAGGDMDRGLPGDWGLSLYAAPELGERLRLFVTLEGQLGEGPRLLVTEDALTRNRLHPDTGASQSLACRSGCGNDAYSRLQHGTLHGTLRLEHAPGLVARGDSLALTLHTLYQSRGPFIGEWDTLAQDSTLETLRTFGRLDYELPLARGKVRLGQTLSFDVTDVDRAVQVTPDGYKEPIVNALFPRGQRKTIEYAEQLFKSETRLQLRFHPRNILVLGLEAETMVLDDYRLLTNYDAVKQFHPQLGNHQHLSFPQAGKRRTVVGAYAEDILVLPLRLRLVLGARFDWYSDSGAAFSPRTALVWRRGGWTAKAFFGMAFRAPTFEELYDESRKLDFGAFVGNEVLSPSTVKTGEASLAYTWPLWGGLFTSSLNGFYTHIADSVDRAPLTLDENPYRNSSSIDSFGFAAEARLSARRLHAFANVSWFRSYSDYHYVNDKEGLDVQSETELTSVPALRANLGARAFVYRGLHLTALLEVGSARRNNRRTPLEKQHFYDFPPYYLLSAGVGYQLRRADTKWMNFSLFFFNMTDEAVADAPFRANRMPQGIPRDRLRAMLMFDSEL